MDKGYKWILKILDFLSSQTPPYTAEQLQIIFSLLVHSGKNSHDLFRIITFKQITLNPEMIIDLLQRSEHANSILKTLQFFALMKKMRMNFLDSIEELPQYKL